MANGFFLGGVAEGMQAAAEQGIKRDTLAQDLSLKTRGLDIQQQTADQGDRRLGQELDLKSKALQIQAQAQKNADSRALFTQVDGQISSTMQVITDTIKAAQEANKDPAVVAKAIAPLVDSAKRLATAGGRDPSAIDAHVFALASGRPTGAEAAAAKGSSEAANALAKSKALEAGGYVDENGGFKDKDTKIKAEGALRDDYVKITKDFQTIRDAKNRIDNLDVTGAGDIALVFQFMKILDPGSTVREGEFATAANAGGIEQSVRAQLNKALGEGQLGATARKQIVDQANKIYQAGAAQHDKTTTQFANIAKRHGMNVDNVIVDMLPNSSVGGVTPSGMKWSLVPPPPPGFQVVK